VLLGLDAGAAWWVGVVNAGGFECLAKGFVAAAVDFVDAYAFPLADFVNAAFAGFDLGLGGVGVDVLAGDAVGAYSAERFALGGGAGVICMFHFFGGLAVA